MKTRLTLSVLTFAIVTLSASAQIGSGRQEGYLPPTGQPGGGMPTDPQQFLEQARSKMSATHGAEKVYDLNILLRGVKLASPEEMFEIRNRYKERYPVAPKDRPMSPQEKLDFDRCTFQVKRTEEHENHRLSWDSHVLRNEIERRVENFRRATVGSSALTVVPAADGLTMLMVTAPISDGEELRKGLGLPNAILHGRTITASISRKDLTDFPELPEDPMDLAGCAVAYLKVGGHHFARLGVDLLSKTNVDLKRPEVGRTLAQFLQGQARHERLLSEAVILLAHWATPEHAQLLQAVSRPEYEGVSPQAKQLAALALRNLNKVAARDAKERAKQNTLPKNLDDATPEQLAAALPGAAMSRRTELLERLEAGKGVSYTEALADIIPRLEDKDKQAARTALQRRLLRMSAKTLGGYLEASNPELTLAAICAIGEKKLAELTPALIKVVEAGEAETALEAHAALENITGKTIKTPEAPTAAEWKKIASQWRDK